MKRRTVVVTGLLLPLAAFAPVADPWPVVREESSIRLSIRAFGMPRAGRFEDWRGDIRFDPEAPERTRATIVIQTASLNMGSGPVTARATSPALLNAAGHPTIRVELQSLRPVSPGRYTARSQVTVRGVTQAVEYPVDLRVDGDRAHLMAAITLDRTRFGIGTTSTWNRLIDRQVMVRVTMVTQRPRARPTPRPFMP